MCPVYLRYLYEFQLEIVDVELLLKLATVYCTNTFQHASTIVDKLLTNRQINSCIVLHIVL